VVSDLLPSVHQSPGGGSLKAQFKRRLESGAAKAVMNNVPQASQPLQDGLLPSDALSQLSATRCTVCGGHVIQRRAIVVNGHRVDT
jgi:hypothetical protein